MENEDIFMQINNLSLSDELAEAKEDSTSKEENDAIITNLGTYMQTFFKSLYRKSIIMIRTPHHSWLWQFEMRFQTPR